MDFLNLILVFVTLAISTSSASAVPFRPDDQSVGKEQMSPFVLIPPQHKDSAKPIEVQEEAQERQDYPPGEAPVLGPMLNAVFGGKRPFEAISGPYYSSSIGPAFHSGPFSGLGVPLSSGPLGGIMGVPLLYLTRSG